jgi:WbqC-like protein family
MTDSPILVPYFMPPVSWFVLAAGHDRVQLATHIPYPRQHYANRCYLKGPHSIEAFTLPVLRRGSGQALRQVQLSHAQPWPRQLARSIENVYRRAAFYEHYAPDLLALVQQPWQALLPLNIALIHLFIKQLGLAVVFEPNTEAQPAGLLHWRPGQQPAQVQLQPYYQLFGHFVPDLSVIDLIMNLGPQAPSYLRSSLRIKEA